MRKVSRNDSASTNGGDRSRNPGKYSRRDLLAKGAAAAAVATVAGLSSSGKAYAANGDNLVVGLTTAATAQTKLEGGSTLWVQDGNTTGSASIYGSQGSASGSYGVHGLHTGVSGVGVFGEANGSGGSGIVGSGSDYDVEARGSGRLGLTVAGQAGFANDEGVVGTIARDPGGNLWYCTASGNPGVWRKLTGPDALGSLHLLTKPKNAYDSRPSKGGTGRLPQDGSRVVSLTGVPAAATAVYINVLSLKQLGAGRLGITAGDVGGTPPALVYFQADQPIANTTVVRPSSGSSVRLHSVGAKQHATIQLIGYYM